MEDDLNESSSSMLPVALGVLAIALGGAGLYFGITASQQLSPISDNLEASSGSAARIEKQIESMAIKLAEVEAQSEDLKKTVNRLRVYGSQSDQAVKEAKSGVESNREAMVKLVEQFNLLAGGKLPSKPQSTASVHPSNDPVVSTASVSVTSDTAVAASGSAASTYNIQSGDNFAKIANNKGISLQALLDANPGVNPRGLQIGQEINIPAK
ncbi:MAG: LysM peptidoglycan-binding domain-containing protein [Opitutaceae bacterium]